MKRVAAVSLLCLLLSVPALAGAYWNTELFIQTNSVIVEACFGYDFVDFIGASGYKVSGDLFYADDNIALWSAPGKVSQVGMSFELKSPRNEAGRIPDRWVFAVDMTTDLHSAIPDHMFRPERSDLSVTLTALIGNWTFFARVAYPLDYYDPFSGNLLPSFGLSGRY